jgi:hypothetical protein
MLKIGEEAIEMQASLADNVATVIVQLLDRRRLPGPKEGGDCLPGCGPFAGRPCTPGRAINLECQLRQRQVSTAITFLLSFPWRGTDAR